MKDFSSYKIQNILRADAFDILQNFKLGPKLLMMPFYLLSFVCMRSVDAFELSLWFLETLPGEIWR